MKKTICLVMMAAHLSGCVAYENRSVSFRPPQEYVNYQDVAGLQVGAESFADKQQAEYAFGFNIREAGLLPVQVVIDNKSGQEVEVVPGQTFLIDSSNHYWKILSNREAVERVDKATKAGSITSGTGKGVVWGAATGTLLGLALGIVSGHDSGSAVAKGGVLGGAGGAVIGGASKDGDDRERSNKIADDVREKGVEGKVMPVESVASGFIFFSGEAESAKELRLQVRFRESGAVRTINLRLK